MDQLQQQHTIPTQQSNNLNTQQHTNGIQNLSPAQFNNLLQQYNTSQPYNTNAYNNSQQLQQLYQQQYVQQQQQQPDKSQYNQYNPPNDNMIQQQQQAQQPQMSTCFCTQCNTHLSFPSTSSLIQCPQCLSTMDPNQHLQVSCIGCSRLLAYPATSLYIQCPKCGTTQDPRANNNTVQPVQQQLLNGTANQLYSQSQPPQSIQQQPVKKRKDPNAPKAVSNAYMLFCQERRPELRAAEPDLPFGKIGARLGELWRTMTVEEKKPYEDLAAADRERYRKEMLDFSYNNNSTHSSTSNDNTYEKKLKMNHELQSSTDQHSNTVSSDANQLESSTDIQQNTEYDKDAAALERTRKQHQEMGLLPADSASNTAINSPTNNIQSTSTDSSAQLSGTDDVGLLPSNDALQQEQTTVQ